MFPLLFCLGEFLSRFVCQSAFLSFPPFPPDPLFLIVPFDVLFHDVIPLSVHLLLVTTFAYNLPLACASLTLLLFAPPQSFRFCLLDLPLPHRCYHLRNSSC